MKPGDLFIVIAVPKRAEKLVRRGSQACLMDYANSKGELVRVEIHRWQFWWDLKDLLYITPGPGIYSEHNPNAPHL